MKQTVLDRAIKEARKKLPFKRDQDMNDLLEYAADDFAEAYKVGAQEAQSEIINRLQILKAKEITP